MIDTSDLRKSDLLQSAGETEYAELVKKLDSIRLNEAIDLETIEDLARSLRGLFGVDSTVLDEDGNVLAATDEGARDAAGGFRLAGDEAMPGGLMLAAIPIVVGRRELGAWVLGPALAEPGPPEWDREAAINFLAEAAGADAARAERILCEMAAVGEDRFAEITAHARTIVDQVSLMAHQNLQYSLLNAAHRRAETSLAETRNALDTILNATSDMVALAEASGEIIYVNDRAASAIGRPKDEIAGHSAYDFLDPEIVADRKALFERVMRSGKSVTYETVFMGYRLEMTISPVGEGDGGIQRFAVFGRDITEWKRAEESLRSSEEKYRELVEGTDDLVVTVDREGRFTFINHASRDIFGLDPEECIGMSSFDFLAPHERERVTKAFTDLVSSGEDGATFQSRHRHVSGRCRDLLWTINARRGEEGELAAFNAIGRDITEFLRKEEAIREYERIVSATSDLISLIGRDYRYRIVNESYARSWGLERENIVGMAASELMGEDVFRKVVKPGLDRCFAGETVNYEEWFDYTAGGRRCVNVNYSPFVERDGSVSGAVVSVRDVTPLKRAEQDRQVYEDRFKFLVDQLPGTVWTMDRDMVFTLSLGNGLESIGLRPNQVVGMDIYEFFGTDDEEHIAIQKHKEALAGKSVGFDLEFGGVYFESHLDPLRDNEGKIVGVLGFALDATERRAAAAEKEKMETQLRETQKLESLGILAGGIAHDFNNLLQGILGGLSLVKSEAGMSGRSRTVLENMERSALRAAELTNQMLAYSGKGKFVVQHVDLNGLVLEMSSLVESSVSKKAKLLTAYGEGLPPIEADATQIRQIVMNLLINASEALPDGAGTLWIETGLRQCGAEIIEGLHFNGGIEPGECVFLRVRDDGQGMDRETVEKVFDPFFTTKFTGRGLGLAAVLGIARGHKAGLAVESEPGKGSAFTVYFKPERAAQAAGKDAPDKRAGDNDLQMVLLADDDDAVLVVGELMIEEAGYKPLLARDGAEAVELFNKHSERIACVVLDLTMPELDGEEALLVIKGHSPETPVLLSSGFNETDIEDRFTGKGLAGFIHKPYKFQAFLDKLRDAVGERPGAQGDD